MVLDPVSMVVSIAIIWIVLYVAGYVLKLGGDDFGILPLILIFRWRNFNVRFKQKMEYVHAKLPQLTNVPIIAGYVLLFSLPVVLTYNIVVRSTLLYVPPSFPPDVDGIALIIISMSIVFVIRGISGHLFSLGEKVGSELIVVIVGVVVGLYSKLPEEVASHQKVRITAFKIFSHALMLLFLIPMFYSFGGLMALGFTPASGALVTDVGLSSPAHSIGFREGMVITEISELKSFGSIGRTIRILSPLDVSFALAQLDGNLLWNLTSALLEVHESVATLGLTGMGLQVDKNYTPKAPWLSPLIPYFTRYLIGWLININLGFLLIGLIPLSKLDGRVLFDGLRKELPENQFIRYFDIFSKWGSPLLLALFMIGLL